MLFTILSSTPAQSHMNIFKIAKLAEYFLNMKVNRDTCYINYGDAIFKIYC